MGPVCAGQFAKPFNALTITNMRNTEDLLGLVEAANLVARARENAEVGNVVLRRRG
ncbi:hypothetical protein AB0M44_40835 [Streptosporangium subroseum]|uniref:hypothetical protein n=1 Tax=Streptosporangium subroseum TaxID=106412 RepID=UPI0034138264